MARLVPALFLSSAVLLAAACADSPTATTPSTTTPSFAKDQGFTDDNGNVFDADGNFAEKFRHEVRGSQAVQAASAKAGPSRTGISYHGGPVLQAGTNVVAIYWAAAPIYNGGPAAGTTGAGSADGSLVGYFMSHLGGSPYFNINTTYTNSAGLKIANVVNYTGYWANNASVPVDGQKVTDANMVSMLQSGFTNGQLTYNASTLYVIFTAGTVNLGGGFGTQYCGYHTHANVTLPNGGGTKTILYAALPYDNAYPSACTNGTAAPNGDAGADNEVSVLAHEIEETTTDMMGNAWYDSRGYENADKCAWNFGTTTTTHGGVSNIQIGTKWFLVQQNWINSGSGGCRLSW